MNATSIVEFLLEQAWIPPALPDPQPEEPFDGTAFATEELALEYIEGEVGRFDHRHNWPQHKKQHGDLLREKVAAWLNVCKISHDPQSIIDFIDNELMKRPGKWL